MGKQDTNLPAWAARQQMRALDNAGYEAYRDGQLAQAAELFKSALTIAETLGEPADIVSCRFWYGIGLYYGGQLRQALAAWTPILQSKLDNGHASDVCNTIVFYIEVAQSLPTSLNTIEKANARAESFLRDTGHMEWRHLLLNLRAELLKHRGMYAEALTAAQESWATWLYKYPNNTSDTHFESLVDLSLRLRKLELALRYMAEWEQHSDNSIPKERTFKLYNWQSSLARLEGRASEAVEWARRALPIAGFMDHESNRVMTLIVMARAFLCAGEVAHAREPLSRLLVTRHSEYGHHRYAVRLLRGDYHLACAREMGGMPPRDDEHGTEFPAPASLANAQAVARSLERARKAYAAALKIGLWIDEQLRCAVRQQEIAQRLRRIKSIEQQLA
jgi:tetratricopeptide (TPR) repeat protein